jgi:hypothetical protein
MRYEQAKPLVEQLMNVAVLYHAAPSLLREKIYGALDEFLPDLDEGCRTRGCIAVDRFYKEKANEATDTTQKN